MASKRWIGLSAAVIGLLGSAAASAGDADFTLVNGTGYDIREVYISAANKKAWGSDRLGNNSLDNTKSRLFKFSDSANCNQDIKVVFDDSDAEVIWDNIDLCEVNKLTLKYNRAAKTVTAIKE